MFARGLQAAFERTNQNVLQIQSHKHLKNCVLQEINSNNFLQEQYMNTRLHFYGLGSQEVTTRLSFHVKYLSYIYNAPKVRKTSENTTTNFIVARLKKFLKLYYLEETFKWPFFVVIYCCKYG